MSIGTAIVNQALNAASSELSSGLKKVKGNLNLPGSALGRGKSAFGSTAGESINLTYPINVENDEQQGHYIMFKINRVDKGAIKKEEAAFKKAQAEFEELANDDDAPDHQLDPPKRSDFRKGSSTLSGAPKGAIIAYRKPTVHMEKAISLYMPPQVKVTYGLNYESDHAIGQGAQAAVDVIQKAVSSGQFTTMSGAFDYVKKNWKEAGQTMGEGLAGVAATWAKGIETLGGPLLGMQGTTALTAIASGIVMGSKMELLFTGVQRRKFSFTFVFIPKSEKESEMVAKIIHTFKKYMMPSFGSVGVPFTNQSVSFQGRILKIPNTFDIFYMWSGTGQPGNPWLNRISTCYLINMDVQYGSEKTSFYEPLEKPAKTGSGGVGPPPTHTTITLNFEEIEKMSRERIEEGF